VPEFLGFILNIIDMTVTLTKKKKTKTINLCNELLQKEQISIRMLARLLGKIASSFLVVPHGKLHNREMEGQKTESLKTVIATLNN